jgi:hypothetical protein
VSAGKGYVSKPSQLYNLEKYSDFSLFEFPFSNIVRRRNLGPRERKRVPLHYSRELNIDPNFKILCVVLATDEVRKIRQDKSASSNDVGAANVFTIADRTTNTWDMQFILKDSGSTRDEGNREFR